MQSKVQKDIYETDEPQKEFTLRIDFCTQVYNDSVRAMRYPSGAHRKGELKHSLSAFAMKHS